jgi:ribonuclease-3
MEFVLGLACGVAAGIALAFGWFRGLRSVQATTAPDELSPAGPVAEVIAEPEHAVGTAAGPEDEPLPEPERVGRHLVTPEMEQVEQAVGHTFVDGTLLRAAFMHRSYSAEMDQDVSYERLEFLGDAVLQLGVTRYLYERFPHLSEGAMAKVRAAIVNEAALARIAPDLAIPQALLLGRGEEMTDGREKDSILADAVESLLGALYLDAGPEWTGSFVRDRWSPLADDRAAAPERRDHKSFLFELLARRGIRPRIAIEDWGPDHAKEFRASVVLDDEVIGSGVGTSKRRAEQAAAREALEALGELPADDA